MAGNCAEGVGRSRVERALARVYERLGSRVFLVVVLSGTALGLATMTVLAVTGSRFLEVPASRTLPVLAIWAPVTVALVFVGILPSVRQVRTVLAWRGDGRSVARAPATWHAVVGNPTIVARCAICIAVAIPPGVIYVVSHFHKQWWAVIPLSISAGVALAAATALQTFSAELLLRPMLEDVAAHLPADFEPPPGSIRLRVKALAPLPVVTAFAAAIVGAYSNLAPNGMVRAAIAIGGGLATTAIATIIFLIINRSLLSPIDHLIAATERVRAGDVATPVPVLSTDELGALAGSFNRMLAELRRQTAELTRRADELRESRERIVAAADAERRRMERDLHDGAQQQLVLLNLKLGLVRRLVEQDPGAAASAIDELAADLQGALGELRDLAHGIYPALLESDGLRGALNDAVRRAALPSTLECDGARRYRPEIEAAVYFCCLEALQNAAKHAGPGARATVRLADSGGWLAFEVSDDGRGHEAGAATGAGIQNMGDRIGALRGELSITSAPGQGTTVSGRIPLASP
jgi:signal transduction histidine kinase